MLVQSISYTWLTNLHICLQIILCFVFDSDGICDCDELVILLFELFTEMPMFYLYIQYFVTLHKNRAAQIVFYLTIFIAFISIHCPSSMY